MHSYHLQGIRTVSFIVAAGMFLGNSCFAGLPDNDPAGKSTRRQENETMFYIGFVGRKMIKPLKKTEYIIEVYKLPPEMVMKLNKLQYSSKRYNYKDGKKQQQLLSSLNDSCKVYSINNQYKYKYFYPQGLKKGSVVPKNEFLQWDFATQLDLSQQVNIAIGKADSVPASAQVTVASDDLTDGKETGKINLAEIKPENKTLINRYIIPGLRTYVFYPWDTEADIDSQTPYNPYFNQYIDSLFLHLPDFSECLGAQRIKLELFDQPFAASFYSRIYIHYVDSIVNILSQNPLIKPGGHENFILLISKIITDRFKYEANTLLWKGLRKNRLDCDNTAYLVYDIGKKLGFEISVVFLWYHALVVVGDYAYETTSREYFPKEQLRDHYSTVFLITPDPKKIHAFLSIYEIALDLDRKKEKQKAEDFRKIAPRYFPEIKVN